MLHEHLYKVLQKHKWKTCKNIIASFLKMCISPLTVLVIRTLDLQNIELIKNPCVASE